MFQEISNATGTAALDAARLSASVQFRGTTMIFTWPSKEKLLDYGYDRESAMWSRDAMERLPLPDVCHSFQIFSAQHTGNVRVEA